MRLRAAWKVTYRYTDGKNSVTILCAKTREAAKRIVQGWKDVNPDTVTALPYRAIRTHF